jgi:hypothetical protein
MVQPQLAPKWRLSERLTTHEALTVPGRPRVTTYVLLIVAHVAAILFEKKAP